MISTTMDFTELADKLFDVGAVKIEREGKFRFKRHVTEPNAPLSPIYFNFRTQSNPKPGPLTSRLVVDIALALYCLARDNSIVYDIVSGIPNAGEPFAEQFLHFLWNDSNAYFSSVFFEKEETGVERRIARLKPGTVLPEQERKLILLDDVLEGAETKFETIRVAEDNGLEVAGILTLVRYDYALSDASLRLEQARYAFHSVFAVSELVEYYFSTCRIDREQYDAVIRFLSSR